jgi:hypothetical protein
LNVINDSEFVWVIFLVSSSVWFGHQILSFVAEFNIGDWKIFSLTFNSKKSGRFPGSIRNFLETFLKSKIENYFRLISLFDAVSRAYAIF